MNNLFINLSNHPSSKWSAKQIDAALKLSDNGPIIDMPFPNIDPEMSSDEINALSDEYVAKIINLAKEYETDYAIIHVMGEMTFTYSLVHNLNNNGYYCYASTTKRNVIEKENGTKISTFEFVQFRRYSF